MKELSTEQKAKAYDNVREKIATRFGFNVAEEIFSEYEEIEDEKIRKALMQNLQERFGTKGNMGKGLDMPDVLAWLEKQGEKTAWSEEDEKYINDLIAYFSADMSLKHTEEDIVDWLKSLRPQSQWRPSEEQMGVIEAVINNRSFQRRHLDSLYEQLKKLRGE